MTTGSGTCWRCGRELERGEYGRADICPGCKSDTKACRNCDFYDERANNACREPTAELVGEKTKSNFCDFFRPGRPQIHGEAAADSGSAAKSAFDELFKKNPPR